MSCGFLRLSFWPRKFSFFFTHIWFNYRQWKPCVVLCLGLVSESTHQVEEEEHDGTKLHSERPHRTGLGQRSGGRGVQQTPGPGLWRRQDPTAAAKTPPSFLCPTSGATSCLIHTHTHTRTHGGSCMTSWNKNMHQLFPQNNQLKTDVYFYKLLIPDQVHVTVTLGGNTLYTNTHILKTQEKYLEEKNCMILVGVQFWNI